MRSQAGTSDALASARAEVSRLQAENVTLAHAATSAAAAAEAALSAVAAAPGAKPGTLDLATQMARLSSLLDVPGAAAPRPVTTVLDRRVEALAAQFAELTKRAELDAAAAADVEAALVERCTTAELQVDALRKQLEAMQAPKNWTRMC